MAIPSSARLDGAPRSLEEAAPRALPNPQKKSKSRLLLSLQLVQLVRPMWPLLLLAMVTGVLGFLTAIFISITGARGVLTVLEYPQGASLAGLMALLIVLGVLRGVLRYVEQLANHTIAFTVLALLRDRLFQALRRLSPAKLEGRQQGELIALVTADIELMEVFYAHTLSPLVIGAVTSLIMTGYLMSHHPLFGLIGALGYLSLGVVVPLIVSRIGKRSGRAQLRRFGALNSLLLESLRGLRELIQFGAGAARRTAIDAQTASLRLSQRQLMRAQASTGILISLVVIAFPVALLLVGQGLYLRGEMGMSSVLLASFALYASFGPVIALSNLANNLNTTFPASERVMALLAEEPVVEDITTGRHITVREIHCQDVGFSYRPGEQVLSDVNLHVAPRRITGIRGQSGSGKSTLLKLMMRFWSAKQGTVSVSGVDIERVNTRALRESQSLITQTPQLFDDTIAANLRVGRQEASHEALISACKKANIHELIESLERGYETPLGELGSRLSSGEKQRLCLARALLHDAPLILLDEPTSNVDALNEGIMLRSLKEESDERAVVLVSHRPAALRVADTTYTVESGRIS